MHATLAAPVIAEQIWAELTQGNQRFCAGTPQPRDLVRERQSVAQSQRPKAMVLACSDSRVAPEIIFDQRLGDLFVVRAAGNVADKHAIGSLEYAAEELGPSLLIVIGHENCGGIKAACSGGKAASPNLKAIIAAIRNSRSSAAVIDSSEMLRGIGQENVRYVARSVLDRSEFLATRVRRGELAVVPAYYHLDTGAVERL